MSLQDNIRRGLISGSGFTAPPTKNTPAQYADRQFPYLADPTERFTEQYAKYASDFFNAQVQFISADGTETWQTEQIRMANVVRPSAAISRNFDDFKMVLFKSRKIDYIQPGTKLIAMGSTWLAFNPDNISSVVANGIFRRCNTVWNYLDYYGNVVSEPICVENARASANTPDSEDSMVITAGYFNVLCQYNAQTAQINDNTRFVLGKRSYMVSGFSDFQTEFTGDYSSVRLLSFAVRVEEHNDALDDMENHVAGGKAFSWAVNIAGSPVLTAGQTAKFSASSVRNGETVESTAENPITYVWESSDDSIAAVAQDGTVTAISEGAAVISVYTAENPANRQEMAVMVQSVSASPEVRFTSTAPAALRVGQSAEISAAYFIGGAEQAVTLKYSLNAQEGAYGYTSDGNTVTVTCYGASDTPLTITAKYGAYSAEISIDLEGL